jgi:DNA polymerase III alpha subunit
MPPAIAACVASSPARISTGPSASPRFTQALLEQHREGLLALSGGRDGEIARRLLVGDREGARAAAERYATLYGSAGARSRAGDVPATAGFFIELSHHLLPDDDWLVAEHVALADELGLPVVVTNDVHYARPEDRELHDVLTGIFHGRTLETLADLRRPDGESYLKSAAELAALPPTESPGPIAGADARVARAWAEGIATSGEIAASCAVDLAFEQYRFPGFPVPNGETAFSYLSELCWAGARKRYHPLTAAVMSRLAHELGVIERAGPRRVLPHLLGPDALREGAGHPGAGPGQRDELDRVVHARDQPGGTDRPQPPVRAVHQRGPDDVPGRRHRLLVRAAGGGHPVRLPRYGPEHTGWSATS